MEIHSKQFTIPTSLLNLSGLSSYFQHQQTFPLRFSVISSNPGTTEIDVDMLYGADGYHGHFSNIFGIHERTYEDISSFNVALVIPTGVGAEIGGHCGDGNVVARLIGSACDNLLTHPNVVNASDINEMPDNCLYVEGSTLSRVLLGQIGLQKVRSNRILIIMDKHEDEYLNNEVVNAVSSARVTLGIDCDVIQMDPIIQTKLEYTSSGRAAGSIQNLERILDLVESVKGRYDAIGLSGKIESPLSCYADYMTSNHNDVNPYGGIEAMLTHSLSIIFDLPFAHSPMEYHSEYITGNFGIVDPRKAPETASITYLHCILKGLARSPELIHSKDGITASNISCLIQPASCIGIPTLAALRQDIPIIAVKNKTVFQNDISSLYKDARIITAENYFEAVGYLHALRAGISANSLTRPIKQTVFIKKEDNSK
ncbi:High light inducible protein [Candidatus Desulfarcum epimagneticum]|uniref:High light inducible protein n=1 Tax=uncultured Desulfobacteraceae bacterium TaxID=218296 RepID=A0A484HFJ8_9BACT|nr:High light inducible protein [uncultured Desulfobacteraceae bacterium]